LMSGCGMGNKKLISRQNANTKFLKKLFFKIADDTLSL